MKKLLFLLSLLCVVGVAFSQNYLTFTAQKAGSTVCLVHFNNNNPDIKYSTDQKNWYPFEEGGLVTLANVGDRLFLRGFNPMGVSRSKVVFSQFAMSGLIAASGSVMSLIDNMGESDVIPPQADFCFFQLFRECSTLTEAPDLPAKWLAEDCYEQMFMLCTRLRKAPELPATHLARFCYAGMFNSCSALEQGADIPAMEIPSFCCIGMYRNCTALKEAPGLPATTVSRECYRDMFFGCTLLTKACDLPATETVYDCYRGMFKGCSSLEKAPYLPSKTLDYKCYFEMFKDCDMLNSIKVNFTEWGYNTFYWLSNCADHGVIECPKDLPEEFGPGKIPEGWEIKRF